MTTAILKAQAAVERAQDRYDFRREHGLTDSKAYDRLEKVRRKLEALLKKAYSIPGPCWITP